MADILLGYDKQQFSTNIERKGKYLKEYNQILGVYNALSLAAITGAEFKTLVLNPAFLVFDKITGGQDVEIAGLKVNKEKAMEILEKPAGYQNLLDVIDTYKKNRNDFTHYLNGVDIVGGEIVLSQSVLDSEVENSKIWAKSQGAKTAYAFAQAVIKLSEETFGPGPKPDLHRMIGDFLIWEGPFGTRQYSLNLRAISNVAEL